MMVTRVECVRSDDQATAHEEPGAPEDLSIAYWYAVYTRSHCEQLVYNQLVAKGFEAFLPKIEIWSRRAGRQHLVPVPMFSNYLFLHHAMDKTSYIAVCQARGLVRILGERWDRLGVVPEADILTIQKLLHTRLRILPHSYLKEGQRVRIIDGPLAGVEGIFLRSRPEKGMLVLSIDLLQRSVAVEVDCSVVVAA